MSTAADRRLCQGGGWPLATSSCATRVLLHKMTNVAQLGWQDASPPSYLANGIRGVKPSELLAKTTNPWRRTACAADKPVRGATAAYVEFAVEKH